MSTTQSPEKPPVALIAGPTASGKSDLAVRLALAHGNAVVINADSAQVYADLHIVSARPTDEDMQDVPHRLFGVWDGAQACSAADWTAAARREVEAAHQRAALPILVGGSGLYLRTLLNGIAPVPAIDPVLRSAVRELPVAAAYAALLDEDPLRAAVLSPSDGTRVARALEVVRSTGRSLASWQAERSGGIADVVTLYPAILLPDRDWLYARCDFRFARMLDQGAIAEVETLLGRRLDPALPVMRAIGVPEIGALLAGDISRGEAIARGQQATRNYAKRQYTWFRRQPPADWPRLERTPTTADFDALMHRLVKR